MRPSQAPGPVSACLLVGPGPPLSLELRAGAQDFCCGRLVAAGAMPRL